MTLFEIITNIFESLGEPSDLDFYNVDRTGPDTTKAAWAKLVSVVNTATTILSTWKRPDGRQIRMRSLEAVSYFTTTPLAGPLGGPSTGGLITVGGLPAGVDRQRGKLAVGMTSGAKGDVIWSSGESLLLTNETGTWSTGETVRLYQREWKFVLVTGAYNFGAVQGIPYRVEEGSPIDVAKVVRMSDGSEMEEVVRTDRLDWVGQEIGVPTRFKRVSRGFLFDRWPEDGLEFLVRYWRGPKVLTVSDAEVEPELPVQFHWGLVLWGKWWGLSRNMETTDAYAVRKDLEDFMYQTITEDDLRDNSISGQIKIYPEGR